MLKLTATTPYIGLCFVVTVLQACTSSRDLMTTPNLFLQESSYSAQNRTKNPESPDLDMLYVTDRLNESNTGKRAIYKNSRSTAAAFGEATVKLKPEIDWEGLSRESDGASRDSRLSYSDVMAVEQGLFPDSPYLFSIVDGQVVVDSATQSELKRSRAHFRRLIIERLGARETNDVVLFVHGFNNSFEYAAQTLGGIWHFLQRRQVPILYSWPAGAGGLRGYFVDKVSGEFTIFHLKEVLRMLFEIPEIENLHIIAHSRGTDVVTSALRELIIEDRGNNRNSKEVFRIENLILAAPDLDYGVIRQRLMAEAFGSAFGKITVYTTNTDKALTISQLLMRGIRFGLLANDDIDKRDRSIFERVGNVSFVQAQDIRSFTGHDYFVSDPAVSSDLLSVINNNADPGSALRPLVHQEGNFWLLPPGYLNAEYDK